MYSNKSFWVFLRHPGSDALHPTPGPDGLAAKTILMNENRLHYEEGSHSAGAPAHQQPPWATAPGGRGAWGMERVLSQMSGAALPAPTPSLDISLPMAGAQLPPLLDGAQNLQTTSQGLYEHKKQWFRGSPWTW